MLKTKSITIVTGNYYPEDTAIGLYTTQFCEYLSKNGYTVTVITGFPYYPQWKISENYIPKSTFFEETINDIRIIRYKQYVPKKVNLIGRVKMMLSFLYGALKNIKKVKQTDLVICIVPFTLSIIPSFFLSKKTKSKLWIHIQDFEFDLALQSGILEKKNIAFKAFNKAISFSEKILLNKASVISSISYSMLKKVNEKSKCKEVFFFPNWVSSEKIDPIKSNHHPLLDKNKFTILYSGNVGEKQDWKTFENLCELINDESIEIIIVGAGGYFNTLKEKTKKFDFIKYFPPVPYEELSDLLCSADVHILFQKTDVIDTIMPSKLLGMMASGKTSIITGNSESEVSKIIQKSNGGFYFSDGNITEIYNTIIQLKNNPELAIEMGSNARNFISSEYSETEILLNFEQKIKSTL